MMSDEKSRQGQDGEGRGLPVGWGWREQVGARILEGPGHMGALHLARAHFAGDWQAGDEKSIAVPNRGESFCDAAQREAEAALWRCDGFGVGEVRGARMMLGQQPTIVGADRLFCLMDLPGLWRVIRVPLNSEAIVEVDAVRAPAEPIRIAVGAPDPLGLGVGEHDAPGGGPCSCGAWHRAPVAEPAPLSKTGPSCKWELCRAPLSSPPRPGCGARHHHDADDAAEPAPREPPAPTDDPGDEPPWQSAPDRAAWLMLPVSLVGDETISGPRYNELASVARGLHIRVAELEAANEGLAQIVNARAAAPPPGTVAALLRAVEEARATASGTGDPGVSKGLTLAARLIAATLGAPTPLDLAMGEVCALLPRVTDDGGIPFSVNMHFWGGIVGEVKGVAEDEDPSRETLLRIVAEGLAALLACDASATKEPG